MNDVLATPRLRLDRAEYRIVRSRALIFDLDGTLGSKEQIRAYNRLRSGAPVLSDAEIVELHRIKTAIYAELIGTIASGGCPFRPGVEALLSAALTRSQRSAIATTTSRGNIDALLAAALSKEWADLFAVIVADDDLAKKKPAPDVYCVYHGRRMILAAAIDP